MIGWDNMIHKPVIRLTKYVIGGGNKKCRSSGQAVPRGFTPRSCGFAAPFNTLELLTAKLRRLARSRSLEFQVNLRNPVKFTKTRKTPQNLLKIVPNTCMYNIFETYLGCWSCLLAINLQIYGETLSLQ